MKIITAAIALAFASPALAQSGPTGPTADPHAQHRAQQPGADHSQHQGMQHGQHQGGQQGQHQGHGQQANCCADRNRDGRMDCCENMAQSGQRRDCCPEQTPRQGAQPQGNQNR